MTNTFCTQTFRTCIAPSLCWCVRMWAWGVSLCVCVCVCRLDVVDYLVSPPYLDLTISDSRFWNLIDTHTHTRARASIHTDRHRFTSINRHSYRQCTTLLGLELGTCAYFLYKRSSSLSQGLCCKKPQVPRSVFGTLLNDIWAILIKFSVAILWPKIGFW